MGFEVRARSVDVSRYEGNPSDPNDMSCKIKPVSNDVGGLVLNSKQSRRGKELGFSERRPSCL